MSTRAELRERFWSTLLLQLASKTMPSDRHVVALQWLGATVATPERSSSRKQTVRSLENGVLEALQLLRHNALPEPAHRQLIMKLLIPLVDTDLLQDMDVLLRRCLGYWLSLAHRGSVMTMFSGTGPDGQEFQIDITEEEQEKEALSAIRKVFQDKAVERVIFGPVDVIVTLERTIPGTCDTAQAHITFPYVNLLWADDAAVQPFLVKCLLDHLTSVDPPLGMTLFRLRDAIFSPEQSVRFAALKDFSAEFLLSRSFDLRRDLGQGLLRLSRAPLAELDAYCGVSGLSIAESVATTLTKLFSMRSELGPAIPVGTIHTLFLLGLRAEYITPSLCDPLSVFVEEQAGDAPTQIMLGELARNANSRLNVFEGLWSFAILLLVGSKDPDQPLEIAGQVSGLKEWVRAYVRDMLATMSVARDETARRTTHALTMQLSVFVADSRTHVTELVASGCMSEDVVRAWLVRSLILTDRILPIVTHDSGWNPDEIVPRLNETMRRLEIEINPEMYPDLLNPFVYGPEKFDHAVVALLALLVRSWDLLASSQNGRAGVYWLSDEVRDALTRLAARPYTEAENMFVKGRDELGKPNRLGALLDRTPRELGLELLERAGG